MLGWGTVLPYQYAYAANTRGWGALTAALASTLFSVGALVAAPFAGRLSDRFNPVAVAVVAKLLAAVGVGGLVWAQSAPAFLVGMFVFGFGLTAAGPAASVLVLRWAGSDDRRKVFAYKFTAEAIGMAVGAFVAGQLVDLSRTDGMTFAFVAAGVGFAISAVLIHGAGIGAPSEVAPDLAAGEAETPTGTMEALRRIFAVRALRWTAIVTVALQVVVVRVTARRNAASLLMVVGGVWTLSWVVLSAAQLAPEIASALFVTTFGIFAVGETMYAPVLNPLTASLAPQGLVGTTLGTFTAIQTTFSALGPLVAGALLGMGLANGFLALHLVISLTAVYGAWRLRAALRDRRAEERRRAAVDVPIAAAPADHGDPVLVA